MAVQLLAVRGFTGTASEVMAERYATVTPVSSGDHTFELTDGDTDVVYGFTQGTASAAGKEVLISHEEGPQLAIAGAAISRGANVCPDGANPGRVKTAATGDLVCGYALTAASGAGSVFLIYYTRRATVVL